jgi:hypothetical protein
MQNSSLSAERALIVIERLNRGLLLRMLMPELRTRDCQRLHVVPAFQHPLA